MAGLHSLLIDAAKAEGFPLAGALDIDSVVPAFQNHVSRYDDWLSKGYDAAMSYLRRGRDRRADPRQVFPEAQSILCVAMPYPASAAGSLDPKSGPRYARYLRRQDYHDDIAQRLERVMTQVASVQGVSDLKWKVCVDTSAVLERSWAALAGLGWIGKNTLLIHPHYGSYLFLGEVLINQATGRGPTPLPNYCGNCTRCLNACPTKAFTEPGVLDSNRCVSYWTLEKRGELPINEEQKRSIGTWIAGCDICQEVCPFNTKASRSSEGETQNGATRVRDWRGLLEESPEQYKARIQDSALSRVKPAQFSRNLAITLTNAVLADPDGSWIAPLRPLIEKRFVAEMDPVAKEEWARLISNID